MPKNIDNQLLDAIFSLTRKLKGELSTEENTRQLTLNQAQVVMFIKENNKVKMTDISEQFTITLPSVTSLINSLSKKGLVVRSSDENDRRTVFVSLTKKSHDSIQKIIDQKTRKISQLVENLTEGEKKQLFHIVSKMADNLKA